MEGYVLSATEQGEKEVDLEFSNWWKYPSKMEDKIEKMGNPPRCPAADE